MTVLLIIAAIAAAIYIYAAVAYYNNFKNWYPLCGCKGGACAPGKPSQTGTSAASRDAG